MNQEATQQEDRDEEGLAESIYPVKCDCCGYAGMSDDCQCLCCPYCSMRVTREF